MPFKLNAYLPSKKLETQIKELYYKQYRELVKSLYNVDKKETIQQYNSILEDLCPEVAGKDITFEDKLSLLLTVRNYCVSPDLRLKCTLPDGSGFTISILVENLIESVKKIDKSGIVKYNDITVAYSSYKIRDEYVFLSNNKDKFDILASYIDTIKIGEQSVDFKDLTFNDRLNIVTELPLELTNMLYQNIQVLEQKYEALDFITVKSPVDNSVVLRLSCNITASTLQQTISFLFTENLNNVYKAFYNIVRHAGFSADYVDSITPVELQVYWMYYMQDVEKVNAQQAENKQSTGGLPVTNNSELGF